MTQPYVFDRSWNFEVSPGEFWTKISDVEAFPVWWNWLREFDGTELTSGARVNCGIRAPLAYWLRFTIDIEDVVPETLVTTCLSGDISGPARLEVSPHTSVRGRREPACRARLIWRLDVHERLLLTGTRLMRPLLEWGHERVVAQGLRQFETEALELSPGQRFA